MFIPTFLHKTWSKIASHIVLSLVIFISTDIASQSQKSDAAQIYAYNFKNFNATSRVYYDPSLVSQNNKCLNGLLNRLPQKVDQETTEACLNTFGYHPGKKIKSPVMIVFETGKTSQEVITTLIYKSNNGQINKERFQAVGPRYQEWYAPRGMYTLDSIQLSKNRSFKPAYGNFYSPKGEKDNNGNPVNIGFHGREGNLMAGNGSNGCYRHHVSDMIRVLTIIQEVGKKAGLPSNWYEDTLPIAVI